MFETCAKIFKLIDITSCYILALVYKSIPIVYFRELGWHCQFKGWVRFGYLFRDIRIGNFCSIGPGVFLNCGPKGYLKIGDRVSLNTNVHISSLYGVDIGENTRIAEFVSIRDNDHNFSNLSVPIRSQGFVGSPIEIGSDVWIGRGVYIGKGIKIGDGAVIGANSVVTKNIPPYGVAVGVPAKVIKYRAQNSKSAELVS